MSEKLVIIDGNSLFYRSFFALPLLTNTEGEYSNGVYGFAIQILNIIQNFQPKYIAVAFDAGKHTFRNDLYIGYKANRKPMPDELKSQLEPLKRMLKLMNIPIVEKIGIEGDDIIGILSKKFDNVEKIIVTGDRDSFQLADDMTKIYFTKKGTSDVKVVGKEELFNEYGVTPELFIDLKALQGDTSDNIPGVEGIGPKTATDLIKKFGNLDQIYEHLHEVSPKTREKLLADKEFAYLSKKLATILREGDLSIKLEDCEVDFPFSSEVFEFFKHYEFKSLLKNKDFFKSFETENQLKIQINELKNIKTISEIKELAEIIKTQKHFAYYFNKEEFHISVNNTEYYFTVSYNFLNENILENEFFEEFKTIFESNDIEKICFNSKLDMYKLSDFGVSLQNYFDCAIAKYLVDGIPVDTTYDLFFEEDYTIIASKLLDFSIDYKKKIETENLQFLFYDVEIPLSKVLFSMEKVGFKIDLKVLEDLRKKYTSELAMLEKEIYSLADEQFNINSPKQLSKILYEKMGLPHGKKMSTSAEKLEEIEDLNPIIGKILRYRKVAKFLGTYIDGLSEHIDKNGFVHTFFTQTLTTTGRLSSVEPNLQNIPIRSNESREIRSMFVASDEDHLLIDADYSQIELRLLAHCSDDEMFVNAFKNHIDIHTKTASDVFQMPAEFITPELRRTAKVVNFGIIYGISEYGLADDLKIHPREAKNLIESFYFKHPAISNYMNKQIEFARETGKAKTIFGRTRKMLDINSSNFMLRQRTERASQNMPLQGSAADIIKIAMVNTFNALQKNNLKSKLIMQVHDELIINCSKDEEEQVKEILKHEMENAAKLKVALEVDIKSSYRWSEGH